MQPWRVIVLYITSTRKTLTTQTLPKLYPNSTQTKKVKKENLIKNLLVKKESKRGEQSREK